MKIILAFAAILIGFTSLNVNARTLITSRDGNAKKTKDPYVIVEEGKSIVNAAACIVNGGKITLTKKYSMCDGGKYDGHLAGGNSSCLSAAQDVKALIGSDGNVEAEADFLALSTDALLTCTASAKQWGKDLESLLAKGKKVCDNAANQSSQQYHGYCYLKLSEFAAAIVPDVHESSDLKSE